MDTIRNRADTILDYDDQIEDRNGQLSPKPMTPRRVKRRSVMTRGSNSRHSTTSRRSHANNNNTNSRNSMRTSRRKYQQNPVTKLMDQQQQQMQQQQQQHSTGKALGSFQHVDNPALTASNLQSLNNEIVNSLTKPPKKYSSFAKNIPPDPIYYNTSSSTLQLQQSWNSTGNTSTGLYNPTYQHSTPNLNDGEHVDELYNNRPPSVRSSYSNFHGARPLSSYNPTVAENVFAGITGQQQQHQMQAQQQQQHQQQHQHSHHHHHQQQQQLQHQQQQPQQQQHSPSFSSTPPQNIPFSKRTASRESIRSMAFLNSGPPAYNLNYHTPPDSETTM